MNATPEPVVSRMYFLLLSPPHTWTKSKRASRATSRTEYPSSEAGVFRSASTGARLSPARLLVKLFLGAACSAAANPAWRRNWRRVGNDADERSHRGRCH